MKFTKKNKAKNTGNSNTYYSNSNSSSSSNPMYIPDYEDITVVNAKLKFSNKIYGNSKFSGYGKVYLRIDSINNSAILGQSSFLQTNTIYHIMYDFDLNNCTITLPEKSVLCFDGGSLSNGNIVGNNTSIISGLHKIFNNVNLSGTFNLDELEVEWFGVCPDGNDCSENIQNCIINAYNIKSSVHFNSGEYKFSRAFFIYDGIYIKGEGIYNTILSSYWAKNTTAKSNCQKSAKGLSTGYTDKSKNDDIELDKTNGHNRFYLGDGVVGYYDKTRDTDPNHPLYWPKTKGDLVWQQWNAERKLIEKQGRWIGKTGREGYAKGLIKSSQNPDINYDGTDRLHPYGIVHTGIRNVKITDLQITTNSIDRGKDGAINFLYNATDIPEKIRDKYNSSCLNIYLVNLYLFGLGGSGYSATRAVQNVIDNVYFRQNAVYGLYLNGVTSTNVRGCYANSCLEAGYKLVGVNYSSITSCAADSCSIGYSLNNCNSITLVSCGAEATRYQKGLEVKGEELYKGMSYSIKDSNNIMLIACYASTARNKYYEDNISDDDMDTHFLKNRHLFISNSKNISVEHPFFKSFARVRSTPFRDADNIKCNYLGGEYDPTKEGSRYWQLQNFLTGAMIEINGVDSKVKIIDDYTTTRLAQEAEIRYNNLDILDPGTVDNPLGYNTRLKTVKGYDGNGGWKISIPLTNLNVDLTSEKGYILDNSLSIVFDTVAQNSNVSNGLTELKAEYPEGWRISSLDPTYIYNDLIDEERMYLYLKDNTWQVTNDETLKSTFDYLENIIIEIPITLNNFEAIFPINGKKIGLDRNALWAWRNSLKLVRIHTDEDLNDPNSETPKYTQGNFGYVDVIGSSIDWNRYINDSNVMNKFQINILTQYSDTTLLDGSKKYFDYGKLFFEDSDDNVYKQNIFTTVPGYVYTENNSCNTIINNCEYTSLPMSARKSALSIVSNQGDTENLLSLVSLDNLKNDTRSIINVTDLKENKIFNISCNPDKPITIRGNGFLSTIPKNISAIGKVSHGQGSNIVIDKLNSLIDRLIAHGLIGEISETVTFKTTETHGKDIINGLCEITTQRELYGFGFAYSKTNQMPTAKDGKINANIDSSKSGLVYSAEIPRDASSVMYIRAFVYINPDLNSESSRLYDDNVITIKAEEQHLEFTPTITVTDTLITINCDINTNMTLYGFGAGYSTTNKLPTASNNNANGTMNSKTDGYSGTVSVSRKSSSVNRYIRLYVYISDSTTESSRKYDTKVIFVSGNSYTIL